MTQRFPPLDLPRLLMRRAGWVALAAWLLMLLVGLQRASFDMQQEAAAADTMAKLVARLAQPSMASDGELIGELRRIVSEQAPRHAALTVRDADGAVLLATDGADAMPPPVSRLVQWHRALWPTSESSPASWRVPRPGGRAWTVTVAASQDSERAEAVIDLASLLGLGALGSLALLWAMRGSVHRSLAPLHSLLRAIGALRDDDARALRALPTMPVGELQAITVALRELAGALEEAERQRRALSRQVSTLQEEERQRLARELHDEFGQRLTAMRADVAWLAQRVADDAQESAVVRAMSAQCEALHADVRSLLTRLRPADVGGDAADLWALQQMLETLVRAWNASPGRAPRFGLVLRACDPGDRPLPWPDRQRAGELALPAGLGLALYRISQEALTNVARHAGASQAMLQLTLQHRADGDALQWQVSDDGAGLGSLQVALLRGNGLAGIRQRVWSLGADLECDPQAGAGGVCLRARFALPGLTSGRAAHGLAAR